MAPNSLPSLMPIVSSKICYMNSMTASMLARMAILSFFLARRHEDRAGFEALALVANSACRHRGVCTGLHDLPTQLFARPL